ncbi:MAG: pyroglutamyl-peptidase I [Arthrobacter sp.]|uniref:pyroglutamyl-peptidase I n=1 Tax=Arthrobacter sp. TaxID=1667 RepID=UPI00347D31BF
MILLTGFEPFGGDTTNPSIDAARLAAAALNASGIDAAAEQLPCVFAQAPAALGAAIERHGPDVVVCVGLAAGRGAVSLERVAVNLIDARIPDNAGEQPVDRAVEAGGPAAYFGTLPVKRALRALEAGGLEGRISQTAGTYVCNQVFYALMHILRTRGGSVRGGFVHVPPVGDPGRAGAAAPGLEALSRALQVIALQALDPSPDAALAAGAEH